MKLIILIISFITYAMAFAEVGFNKGNVRNAVLLEGSTIVQCNDNFGITHRLVSCQANILDPNEYDYFDGPAGIEADEVILTAIHEDGSKRTKTVSYNSKKSQSKDSINLWIWTVFQRPLLEGGKNTVNYQLNLNGKKVMTGNFAAIVNDGGSRQCRRRGFYFDNSTSCNGIESFCSRYFRDENYCQ